MPRILSLILLTLNLSVVSAIGQQPAVSDIPHDYEIADVRSLPQEFSAALFRPDGVPDKACRKFFLDEFTERFYSPWRGDAPHSDISRSLTTMKDHAGREWYGENRRKVSRKDLDGLLANCDPDRFPSMNKTALAIVPASLRVLPTSRPFFEKPDDFPFDKLQNAGLKINEPIRVLHLSRDGIWAFVETADANGWVQLRDIAYIDETPAAKRMLKPLLVIVRDSCTVRYGHGEAVQPAGFGTLLPIVGEDKDAFEVSLAVASGSGDAREVVARAPKDSARRFPLDLGGENVALVGNELIDKPYGWGGLYGGRDCSTLIRDFFAPFGIWLPRGSYNQITSGRRVFLSGLEPALKERFIRENGVPFLSLLHLNGHIMLYIGTVDEKPMIFHAMWGVNVRRGDGGRVKHVVGKSVVSTLNPGAELPLAGGSLLEKLGSMLVLGERCPQPTQGETAEESAIELPGGSGPD